MKKEIKIVDKEKGILRLTTADERFYIKSIQNLITGLPEYRFVPSVTWICQAGFPKGFALLKWYADHGMTEASVLKEAAGDKGSRVHLAIVDLLDKKTVEMGSKYLNQSTGQEEELTVEEYECLMSFVAWFKETKPEVIAREIVVFSDSFGFAGTIDLFCRIGGAFYIIDFKTSQSIWTEYELQVSAYKQALFEQGEIKNIEDIHLGILQLGYKRNKAGFKWNEIEDKFLLFLSAQTIWANEHGTEQPSQKDYPLTLSLEEKVADVKINNKKKK